MSLTVNKAAELFGMKIVAGIAGADKVINDVYICDLLSWVMGKAPERGAWITILGHVNTVAVALLTEVSCIIIAEGAEAEKDTIIKADAENIPILSSEKTSFEVAKQFIMSGLLD